METYIDKTTYVGFDRALIVRKEWLDKILDCEDPKLWEMRSSYTNIRGEIGLIEAGSGLIVGKTTITDCIRNADRSQIHKHKVTNAMLLLNYHHAWVLNDSKRFEEPIPYTHPRGAVIWVKM